MLTVDQHELKRLTALLDLAEYIGNGDPRTPRHELDIGVHPDGLDARDIDVERIDFLRIGRYHSAAAALARADLDANGRSEPVEQGDHCETLVVVHVPMALEPIV